MRSSWEFSLVVLIALTGCGNAGMLPPPEIKGSGVVKEETRQVAGFTGIDVSATFEVNVTIGSKPSLSLSAEDNLLPLITTEVRDGKLVIAYKGRESIQPTKPQVITIVATSLDQLAARGSSKVVARMGDGKTLKAIVEGAAKLDLSNLDVDQLDLTCAGASRAKLAGKGKRMQVDVTGASTCQAETTTFNTVEATVSGASEAQVHASQAIAGSVSGASSLKVAGQPVRREVSKSGASSVSF